jgi:S-formylglutathione hydrolase FrmB
LTDLVRYAARYPIIIVMPAAEHSFYVNSPITHNAEYETFITQELHAAVVTRFGVDTTREAIAGASMGGYGAAVLALRHPARYRFAGLMIPALSVPDSLQKADTAFASWGIPAIDTAFGPAPSTHRTAHDPFLLLRTSQAATLPYFYVTAAQADPFPSFLPFTRQWVEALRLLGGRYEYHEMPVGHDDAAVDAALPELLGRCWVEITGLRHGAT